MSLYADKRNQVPDFADKILWLLQNPSERERMGAIGRERVQQKLAWEYSVGNLLAAYQTALEGPFVQREPTEATSPVSQL